MPREAPLGTLIVGGGPAGTAVLCAAAKSGRLGELAGRGLVVAERGETIGRGRLPGYAIHSDSTAETFLSAVRGSPYPEIEAITAEPEAEAIAAHTETLGVPLPKTGPFLHRLGEALAAITTAAGGEIMTGHEATRARLTRDGLWRTTLRRVADGHECERLSEGLVLATGGSQPLDRLARATVAGAPLVQRWGAKLLQSDEVLAIDGLDRVRALIAGKAAPRIAVVGGSTSAVTAANRLLNADLGLGTGGLTIVHRRPLRPFYPSAEAALADGFDDFGADDICPVSGFVYRLAGFRLEARALVIQALGIGGREGDPRLALHRIADAEDKDAQAILDRADLVVAALGYRPNALPLFTADGGELTIAARAEDAPPMVDGQCRVLAADGRPIPGLFGIGLAAGFVPHGPFGGEASFRGQANGLWLWQNGVGALIADQLLAGGAAGAVASAAA